MKHQFLALLRPPCAQIHSLQFQFIYFRDILIIKERQLATSTVAWSLLHALNQAEKRADTLENENQLLRNCTEKLEQELNILIGKKKNNLASFDRPGP